jgi:transcriptional regulator with XRE-family HTH domain
MNGQELKERRLKLGLTQRQLSNLLGVSENTVYRWEAGSLSILPKKVSAFEKIEAKLSKRKMMSVS